MTGYDEIDETTAVQRRRRAEAAVETAETATVEVDALLEERQSIMGSIREIYRENNFGRKYQLLLQSTYERGKHA